MYRSWIAASLVLIVGLAKAPVAQQLRPDVPPAFRFLTGEPIPPGRIQDIWDALPFDTIALERTPCYGLCPSYRVTLHRRAAMAGATQTAEDTFGRAELQVTRVGVPGPFFPRFPDEIGEFTGWVHLWTFGRLSLLIEKEGFANLRDRYEAGWTDDTSTIVTVSGATRKSVLDYGGVGPIELWGIQQAIDSTAKGIVWARK